MRQTIHINWIGYEIIDSIQDLRAEDSFIYNKNKLQRYAWNWEARKYVGSYLRKSWESLKQFFDYDEWGASKDSSWKRDYKIISKTCFFSKNNLLKYMQDAKVEYLKQEQLYHNDISHFFDEYLQSIENLTEEINYFSIYDVSDLIESNRWRAYIRSDDHIWKIRRKIILPKISYLSILKIKPLDISSSSSASFYFRILLDYNFRSIIHPRALEDKEIDSSEDFIQNIATKKKKIREWQQKFRKGVVEHMPQCPFSLISDERLLIASHIKPYSVCMAEGNFEDAINHLNWLSLTPTYDRLFDQGYITFSDDGELICGTLLSSYTWDKLGINPSKKKKYRIFPENRKKYLEYHRRNVFRDNIDELL